MTECLNEEMCDLLPMLAHGSLEAPAAMLVRAHVSSCAACHAELEVIARAARMLDAATPALDLAAIVAALPARRARWVPRQYIAAAASVLIVASLASPFIKRAIDGPKASASSVSLTVEGGLSDLSDDDLTALLAELELFEATVLVEPTVLRSPIIDGPGGI